MVLRRRIRQVSRQSRRALARLVVALGAVLLASGLSFGAEGAEPPPRSPGADASLPAPSSPQGEEANRARRREAEARFDRGLSLVHDEKWDAALAEFLASRELFPTRVALKNAATCLRQLGRHAEAVEMLEELLARFAASLSAEERRTLDEALAGLHKRTGEVTIRSDQPGATILVDGRERGSSPLARPVRLDAGTHAVRVFKEGFVAFEAQITLAAQQHRVLPASLRPLGSAGRLVVAEASGASAEVVVDGIVMGKTPWSGLLDVGSHTVLLRGPGEVGTPPTSLDIASGRSTVLTLRAERLDSGMRVEPTPSTARVDIDGVQVGRGPWEGSLRSGTHRVEVAAEGFLAYRRAHTLEPGVRLRVPVVLERDPSDPMWREPFRAHPFAELVVGAALAPSLGGSLDASCSRGECAERSRALGLLAGARGGYQLTKAVGIELFVGFMSLGEKAVRRLDASADVPIHSTAYEDRVAMSGPLAAMSASVRFLERTPVVLRAWAGAMRARASFENGGAFSGRVASPGDPAAARDFSVSFRVPEAAASLWIPFIGPEARIGYRLSETTALDLGLAVLFMLPADTVRTGRSTRDRERGDRTTVIPDQPGGIQLGTAQLPREQAFGAFVAVLPTIAGRFDF
jgi:hypothetical protein